MRAWSSGLRREALGLARDLVAGLDGLTDPAREEFAGWLCTRLFDEGEGWYGQFGGGLTQHEGGYERPVEHALSTQWLYQALIGRRA